MNASPATQSLDKSTPILDRLQPMPDGEKAQIDWYEWASPVLIGLVTFLLVALAASGLPWLRQRVDDSESPKMGWIAGILLLLAVTVMAIVVHELGHFLRENGSASDFDIFALAQSSLTIHLSFHTPEVVEPTGLAR
jgi:hypothetical protein